MNTQKRSAGKNISVVCPCFNEAESITLFLSTLRNILKKTKRSFEIICVDDGSTDATLQKLLAIKKRLAHLRIISLSRNFGKEAALMAGFSRATGQAVIPIDADFQDPPELIIAMLAKWDEGYDVVLAKRIDRSTDSAFKRKTAALFYSLYNAISSVRMPENVGDYRLVSRRALDAMMQLPENQRFSRGMFAWVGFRSAVVEYTRPTSTRKNSWYSPWSMWNLALDGITSFSTIPLRIWLYVGLVISALSFGYASFIVIRTILLGADVPGFASILTAILFLGGLQLVGIGILGEYIGRIYIEAKKRPVYIIEREY